MKNTWEKVLGGVVQTEIKPYTGFFLAEEKHQKYYLKRYKTAYEMARKLFMEDDQFVDSTYVARLNGFVRGFGKLDDLRKEIELWDLSRKDLELLNETLFEIKW